MAKGFTMLPFDQKYDHDKDADLIKQVREGSVQALGLLFANHEPFIFNVAFQLLRDKERAAGFTKGMLLELLLNIHSAPHDDEFRTWLYSLFATSLLEKAGKIPTAEMPSFECFSDQIDGTSIMPGMTEEEQEYFANQINSVQNKCLAGMMSCLPVLQRFIFILSVMFKIDEPVVAKILQVPDNVVNNELISAVRLLTDFSRRKCGLVRPENPCRCHKKAKFNLSNGLKEPCASHNNMIVNDVLGNQIGDPGDDQLGKLFRQQPFVSTTAGAELLNMLKLNDDIKRMFYLN